MQIIFNMIFKLLLVTVVSSSVNAKTYLYDMNETTWIKMLEGEWFIQFYAPWCPACKQLAPVWKEFSEWSEDLSIQVGQIDVTINPGLSGRFMITALPTIYHAKDGAFRLYSGARDKDALFSFIEDKKWSKIDPVSSWSSPQSIPMTTISYFFQLSMTLRDMHNYLTGEMGFHSWTAHVLFGIATILTGILLGLLIVAFIDCLYAVKRWVSSSDNEKVNGDTQDSNEENNDMQPLTDDITCEEEICADGKEDNSIVFDYSENDDPGASQVNVKNVSNKFDSHSSPKLVHRKVPRSPNSENKSSADLSDD